jgi:hypothetical protein
MLENVAVTFGGHSGVEMALFKCISMCIHLAKRPGTHGDRFILSSWYLQHIFHKCSKTRRPFSAVFRASKGPCLSVLVCVFTSRNGLVLTEICSPSPPGTSTHIPQMLENAAVIFGGLSRVKRALFKCISMCIHLAKWPGTH